MNKSSCQIGHQQGICSLQIFHAIPSPLFSAAPELRLLTPNLYHSSLCSPACPDLLSFSIVVLNTSSPSDFVRFPRRRLVKAKSSMVASSFADGLCRFRAEILEGRVNGMGRIGRDRS
jgi:hypothetical protein